MQAVGTEEFRIVCIGGSAGGLAAYSEILRGLPANTGMAFVIVSHRGLEHSHLLPQVLSYATSMPIVEVEHGMRLEPNRVFVMPPCVDMTTSDNHLHLRTSSKPRGWPISLSIFLSSLGESVGPRAIAVIVSGMGDDGSAAMAVIKAAGGVTFAQSNPAQDDMPRHAIETGHVDFVMQPAEIAKALISLADSDLNAVA